MEKRMWTEEEEKLLEEMWNNNIPIKEMAEMFNLAKNTISTRAALLSLPKRSSRMTKDELRVFEELYAQGMTFIEISKLMNRHRSTLEKKAKVLKLKEKYRPGLYDEVAGVYYDGARKRNKYDLNTYEYGVLWTSNTNKKVLFDKEDYDKIKYYCWYEHMDRGNSDGYIEARALDGTGKIIKLHRLVTGVSGFDVKVDHKKHKLWDNRKSELRVSSNQENTMNRSAPKNNTSGVAGVNYDSEKDMWRARLYHKNQAIHLGYYETFEEAVAVRKKAVEEYRGEWSYENSMRDDKEAA